MVGHSIARAHCAPAGLEVPIARGRWAGAKGPAWGAGCHVTKHRNCSPPMRSRACVRLLFLSGWPEDGDDPDRAIGPANFRTPSASPRTRPQRMMQTPEPMEDNQDLERFGRAGKLVRIMLVDDHEVVRSGLRVMLEGNPDLRVVAEAGSVQESVSKAGQARPDVV